MFGYSTGQLLLAGGGILLVASYVVPAGAIKKLLAGLRPRRREPAVPSAIEVPSGRVTIADVKRIAEFCDGIDMADVAEQLRQIPAVAFMGESARHAS